MATGRRAASAFGVRKITPAAVKAHGPAHQKETSGAVRLAVLVNLARARKDNPRVRALIEWTAKSDPVKEVKERAEELLAE